MPVLYGAFVVSIGMVAIFASRHPAPEAAREQGTVSHPVVARPDRSPGPSASASPSARASGAPAPFRRPTAPSVTPASSTRPVAPVAPAGPVEFPLGKYLDNVGAVSDSEPTTGNLDGTGSAFSAQALAKAGATPGARITYNGVPFSWPDAGAGQPDNVTASGQTLPLQGAGRTLALLVTAGWGPVSGSGSVEYVHGPAQGFTIGAPDWWTSCPSATGKDVVVFTPYRNQGNGRASFTACVYYVSIRLRAGSRVRGIVLPDISPPTPVSGKGSLHIFAITID